MSCLKNRITVLILKALFSHVGICFLIAGYMVGGAYLFQWIEGSHEDEQLARVANLSIEIDLNRKQLIQEVVEFCRQNSNMSHQKAVEDISNILQGYQDRIKNARNITQTWFKEAYKGRRIESNNTDYNYAWTIPSAILFTATILTTLGYGHIYPVTETGYIVCIIYSVFAIPLMSMFFVKLTDVLVAVIRLGYHKGCCRFLETRRRREHVANHWNIEPEPGTAGTTAFEQGRYRTAPVDSAERRRSAWAAAAEMGNDHRHESEALLSKQENLVPATLAFIFWALYLLTGAVLFQYWEDNWTMRESFYFMVVTLLTIGFGDYVPGLKRSSTARGKLQFGIVTIFIIVGLGMTTAFARLMIAAVRDHTANKKQAFVQKLRAKKAAKQKLAMQNLYDKDENVDHVSMTPFTH